ncbi:lysine exporter LysO family protein [Nocardia alni]|uniref:lysine exporter LysO family protein n=1 Tax=Nocardia alni TaxID=2815723 RepID=UPI001C22615E|nr:lysine exporter LysO family protein [Nocardia alni]
MVVGTMTVALGTAHADPAQTPAKADMIDYSVQHVNNNVVATLKGGTFKLVNKPGLAPKDKPQQFADVLDPAGNIAMEMPLDYRISGVPIPVQPVLKNNGRVLQLTPQKPQGVDISKQTVVAQAAAPIGQQNQKVATPAQPVKQKIIAQPIASPTEDSAAMNNFATEFGLATGIGSFVGLAIGAVVGCIFGLPLLGVGCLAGIPIGATLGGVIGTIAFGGPALIAAGVDLMNTLQAKPGSTKWAETATPVPPKPKH